MLTIALASGFSDVKSFNAAFRKYFDLSPDRYRRQLNPISPSGQGVLPPLLPPEEPGVARKLAGIPGREK